MISAPARWVSCAAFVCSKRASISPFAVAIAGSGVSSGAAVVSAAPASAAEKTVSVCPFSSFCSIFTSSSASAHAGKAKLSAIRIAVKRFMAYHLLPSIVHEKKSLCKETNAPAFFFPRRIYFFKKSSAGAAAPRAPPPLPGESAQNPPRSSSASRENHPAEAARNTSPCGSSAARFPPPARRLSIRR